MDNKKNKRKNNTFEEIYCLVRKIPIGKVATYGQIAYMMGNPKLSRVVGYAMSSCTYDDVPCHRVVNRFGGTAENFGTGGSEEQKYMLKREGIEFLENNKVNIKAFLWDGKE